MANELINSLATNKETYAKCRKFLFNLVQRDKGKLIKLEDASISVCSPYIIKYIEDEEKLKFIEVLNYYSFHRPDLDFSNLTKIALINCFRKLENGDRTFEPF
jgi:hypothetical protein